MARTSIKMESRMLIGFNGLREWVNENDQLHREDGPAVIFSSGSEIWYQNGQKHREDGPAVIWVDGRQKWYRNGRLHREDGPAVIYPDGSVGWLLNGRLYSFAEWTDELNLDHKTRLEMVMKWNPE